jgi:hypothetical protein
MPPNDARLGIGGVPSDLLLFVSKSRLVSLLPGAPLAKSSVKYCNSFKPGMWACSLCKPQVQ